MMRISTCSISFGKVCFLTGLFFCLLFSAPLTAQISAVSGEAPVDTVYNPVVDYGSMPRKYEIADITVSERPIIMKILSLSDIRV